MKNWGIYFASISKPTLKLFFCLSSVIWIIPLRAKQGGINFTLFALSLPYAKNFFFLISHMDGGQLKNVCLSVVCLSVCLSVCLLSVTSLPPIIFWTVGLIGLNFLLQKLEKMCTVKPVYNGHPWDPKKVAVV
jgi:hypothetical protein